MDWGSAALTRLDDASFAAHPDNMSDDASTPLHAAPSTGSRAIGLVLGLLLILAATVIGLVMTPAWNAAAVVLLYLPPVLVAARYAGLLNFFYSSL